ncbi:MAG TPA: S41 family peptidase, partial [Mycobacteriales bacterium]|nr:S41 family peptidase [Mycobacteriales bacterium]
GSVSGLLLQKLARPRLGAAVARWDPTMPYFEESPAGPMVCLTNEYAGSDGDIFTHGFGMLKLGPVIGMRTWGGVIGIYGDTRLADGTITTQPELSFWFKDVGWGVENYGADPDIELDVAPQDYVAGVDPQLQKGIELALEAVEQHQEVGPDLDNRPNLAVPPLPQRDRIG